MTGLCLKHGKMLTWDGKTCLDCGFEFYETRLAKAKKEKALIINNKRDLSGRRKCPLHKRNSFNEEGQCQICGGWRKVLNLSTGGQLVYMPADNAGDNNL